MNVTITSTDDNSFRIIKTKLGENTVITPKVDNIKTKQLGDVVIATDGERSAIGKTEDDAIQGVVDAQPKTNAAPLENPSKGHPFNPFGGTSWEGRPNGFN